MKTTKAILISIALVSVLPAFGLSSFYELSVGGGWSSLGYGRNSQTLSTLTLRQSGSYGITAHVGLGLQFNKYIGVGIGADFSRYGAAAQISGENTWPGVRDTDGETYDHIVTVNKWTDNQEIYMIEIPLSLYLRFPVAQNVRLYGQIGAKACLPMLSKAKFSGSLTHQGFYEPWMLTLYDVPNHGFYSSSMEGKYNLQTNKFTVAAFIKFGIEAPVDELRNVWLFAAAYGTMHFMPAMVLPKEGTIGWRNDVQGDAMRQAHYFMSDYTSVLNTDLVAGKAWPLAAGLEIGIRFRIPHHKRYNRFCRCEEE